MLKKFLVLVAVALGLIYGSGSDLASIKRSILSASDENARGMTGGSDNDWGKGTHY